MSTTQNSDALAIINALDGSPHSGMCKCPVHEDRKASLHVSTGRSGRVLVRCFAGCAQSSIIESLKTRGLWSTVKRDPMKKSTAELQRERKEEDHQRLLKASAVLTGRGAVQERGQAQAAAVLERS